MLNIDKICKEIEKLEECGSTTQNICKKLAILYAIKDHYKVANGNSYKSATSGSSLIESPAAAMSVPSMSVK